MPESAELFEMGADALEAERYGEAITALLAYVAVCDDAEGWYNLGLAYHGGGDDAAAAVAWRRALATGPTEPGLLQALFDAAEVLLERLCLLEAKPLYESLLSDAQLGVHASLRLTWCLHLLGRDEEALPVLTQGLMHWPGNLALKLQQTLLLPMLYPSREAMVFWREHLLTRLDELEGWLRSPAGLSMSPIRLPSPIFDLMSQGEDEKMLLQRISAVWRRIFVPPQPALAPRRPGRPRLGIVTVSAYNHSTIHYFLGMLELLAGQRSLETAMFYFGEQQDDTTAYLHTLTDQFTQLPMTLPEGIQAILDWQPDILFYLDIGQEGLLYSLAHLRLAPVQCVSAGIPITTGIANMDYYLSSSWFEPPEAQAYYSETLICLADPMVCMRPPQVTDPLRGRSAFGLAEDKHLYIFPHTLIRVDPELDELMARILLQDPRGQLIFIQDRQGQLYRQLQARFGGRYPELADRLRFLAPMPQPDFLNLVALCDVALDSLRLGGGNVSFQCFWVGTPIIHCPTRFLRCRIAAGLYRLAGLDEWIAADHDDYVAKAVKLGTQPRLRLALSERMRQASRERIFNRSEGVEAAFALFEKWAGARID